eukprot:TRINITY_DN5112_c0_g1_i1.p1 TRINITY_DN5112_c0_g1~~TRINITY_DN5112_c0_g1_i1.p1  ORF type:complete len:497 (-),score=161.62 TRINITY_DN5112_c0_g1_i1:57-1547(-)
MNEDTSNTIKYNFLIHISKSEYNDEIGREIIKQELKLEEKDLKGEEKIVLVETHLGKEILPLSIMGKVYVVMAKHTFKNDNNYEKVLNLSKEFQKEVENVKEMDSFVTLYQKYNHQKLTEGETQTKEGKLKFRIDIPTKNTENKTNIIGAISKSLKEAKGWEIDLKKPLYNFTIFIVGDFLHLCFKLPEISPENYSLCFENQKEYRVYQNRISLLMRKKRKIEDQKFLKKKEENFEIEMNKEEELKIPTEPPNRLKKAEKILSQRTSRILLVVEKSYDPANSLAIIRTAETLGVQNLWFVDPYEMKRKNNWIRKISKGKEDWVTIKHFKSTTECIEALRKDNRTLWVTELGRTSVSLEEKGLELPDRMALVIGRESDGVSKQFIEAADKLVYLPMFGFSESLNINVATALCLQRLFTICPECRGDLSESEKTEIREDWYGRLGKNPQQKKLYNHYLRNPPSHIDVDLRRPEELRVPYVQKKIRNRTKNNDIILENK